MWSSQSYRKERNAFPARTGCWRYPSQEAHELGSPFDSVSTRNEMLSRPPSPHTALGIGGITGVQPCIPLCPTGSSEHGACTWETFPGGFLLLNSWLDSLKSPLASLPTYRSSARFIIAPAHGTQVRKIYLMAQGEGGREVRKSGERWIRKCAPSTNGNDILKSFPLFGINPQTTPLPSLV